MSFFHYLSFLVATAAALSYLNHRYWKLPPTIGVTLQALVISVLLILLGQVFPDFFQDVCDRVEAIDFSGFLLEIMLCFLLFAGAYDVDVSILTKERVPVLLFATLGILISTAIVGLLIYVIFNSMGMEVALIHCLLFGALISPTDPIAVLAILKEAQVPKSLEIDIAGESLLNDGVAVVVFMALLEMAEMGVEHVGVARVGEIFLMEAGGGTLLGLGLGWVGSKIMCNLNDDKLDVMVSLGLVMGGYSLAELIHVSGPLAIVVFGLMMSRELEKAGWSRKTRDHVNNFWQMMDEILNAVLFMLIGVELIVITHHFRPDFILAGLIAVVVVLFARMISVSLPVFSTKLRQHDPGKTITVLTWGGLRGGISVALALSLSEEMPRDLIVSVTYIVVLFSITVQGLSINSLVKRLMFKDPDQSEK